MKDNFESALRFALDSHTGQLDQGWTPHIQHLMGVWSRVRFASMSTQIAALLHDVVEDTNVSLGQIRDNFGDDVADVIQILTHQKHVPYRAYIESIAESKNRKAILVKIADLDDNCSPERLQRLPDEKRDYFVSRKENKYLPARRRLIDALDKVDK